MNETKVGPVTPCAERCPCVGDAGPRPATCYERVTTPTDAVAQARELVLDAMLSDCHEVIEIAERDVDALIAAVRAECAAKVRAARWSEHSPFCDKSGVSGCCGMAARNAAVSDILADLEAQP